MTNSIFELETIQSANSIIERLVARKAFGLLKIATARKTAFLEAKQAEDKKNIERAPHVRIADLFTEKYIIFNVGVSGDNAKMPISCESGNKLYDWPNLTHDDLRDEFDVDIGKGYGMRLGLQENEKRIMSLDFDISGDKGPDGKRIGCAFTLGKLTEYRAGIDRVDGLFSSSTAGNFNLLIDYTANAEITALIEEHETKRFKINNNLEIFLSGCQVLPPTATTCKITGQMGQPRKFLGTEPFYVLTDEPFIISYLKELLLYKKPAQISPSFQTPHALIPSEDKWLDLLFNVIRNETVGGAYVVSWELWMKIAGILKFNKYPVETFIQYSVPTSTEDAAVKLWNTNKRIPPMSLFGLQNIAKEINPFGYREWINKHQQFISLTTLERGENDVARYISEQLRGVLVYSEGWWRLSKSSGLWINSNKPPLATIITHLQSAIDIGKEMILFEKSRTTDPERITALTKQELSYAAFYSRVGGSNYSNHTAALLTEYVLDSTFESKLNVMPYAIAYKNGILDLKTLVFRVGIHGTDMLSKTLDFDYEVARPEDVAHVREEFKKICNYNEEHLEYYLGTLGYALTGDSSALCELYYLTGQRACNGKSTAFEALNDILPIYVCKTEKDAFDEHNMKAHKEIGTWGGKRIIWTNEVNDKPKNAEFLKELSDGTTVKYDKLYSTNALMRIECKLFIVSNYSLHIEMDAGIRRRFRHFQMDSEFKEGVEDNFDLKIFKKDGRFGTALRTTCKHAFLHLLFSYSKKFSEQGLCAYPADWNHEKDAIVTANDKFRDKFEELFAVGQNLKISKEALEHAFKDTGKTKLRDNLKRIGLEFTYDSQERHTINGKKHKGFYHGFGLEECEDIAVVGMQCN
jgi:hypothetical protein